MAAWQARKPRWPVGLLTCTALTFKWPWMQVQIPNCQILSVSHYNMCRSGRLARYWKGLTWQHHEIRTLPNQKLANASFSTRVTDIIRHSQSTHMTYCSLLRANDGCHEHKKWSRVGRRWKRRWLTVFPTVFGVLWQIVASKNKCIQLVCVITMSIKTLWSQLYVKQMHKCHERHVGHLEQDTAEGLATIK